MFLEIFIALCGLVFLFYKWYCYNYNYWSNQGIPSMKPEFPFGNLKDVILMRKTMGDLYAEMYWKFPDEPFFGFYKLRNPILMVRDPELVKEVLVKQFTCFDGNDYYVDPEVDPILGLNPFNCKGEKWKEVRGLITPSLTGSKIKSMIPHIITTSNEMISYLREHEGEFIETFDVGGKFTTDVVSSCAYSLKSNSFVDPDSEFRKMSQNMFSGSFQGNAATLFSFYAPKLGSLFKWKILSEEVTEYFEQLIKKAALYRIENKIQEDDLLQVLINTNQESLKKNKKPAFSYKEMAGHCMTFSLDGFETGALLISYLLYELSINLEVQNKLRNEILEKVNSIEDIKYDTIHSIEYLDWSISECLRKHSPGTTMARKCSKSTKLEVNGKSVKIPQGMAVALPLLSIMNNPANFPDPHKFLPERFDGFGYHHPYSHFPFGGGPRSCPGKQFALTMVKMALISILINFKLTPKDETLTKIEEDPMYSFFHHSKIPLKVSFNKI